MLDIVDEPLEPGRVVIGRWRLERPVGEGGMGIVWAARDDAGRAVALKFLRSDRGADPKSRARFLREARAAMAVSHPHIGKVHEVLETETGQPFLVMDLLEGQSLRAALRANGRIAPAECARIFGAVAAAVEAAHAAGIVHRDLKPENVFLVGGHDVRVLDFGIAKLLPVGDETASASLTSTGALLGTPHYMAPEQIFGDGDLDGRADVWALGVMLYECLAGARPFEGLGLGPIMKRITVDPIRPLHDACPDVPLAMCTLVDRMLSRAKEQRPSLAEVKNTLARVAAPPFADVPTRIAPKEAARIAPLPPSTTIGVASRRATVEPAPARSRRGAAFAVAVAASAIVVVGAGTTIAALRFAKRPQPKDMSSATASTALAAPVVASELPVEAAPAVDGASPSASASSASATAALANATPGAAGPADHAIRARLAAEKGDAAGCLRDYDAHDRLETNPALRSTSATSGHAPTRARCMMLAGDCDGGRALLRSHRLAQSRESETKVDLYADGIVAANCNAPNVPPRDELRRSSLRLQDAADGKRKATSKDCLAWYGNVTRLAGTVPPRSSEDTIGRARDEVVLSAPSCLARAGDCTNAYRVFKDEITRTRRPAPTEPDLRDEFDVLTHRLHACEGAP